MHRNQHAVTARRYLFWTDKDFSYPLDPELFVVPKGFEWNNLLETHTIRTQYSFMGIGQDISPIIFADGVNADREATDYKKEVRIVTAKDKLNVQLAPGGGWTARITKK